MPIGWNAFWTRVWFGITQFFTKFGGHALPKFTVPNEIVQKLDFGSRYRSDRRAGAMTHPKKVQKRLDAGAKLGDCEDHMGYWVHGLINSGLADEVHAGLIYYFRDGKREGHFVTVFRRANEWFWADYANPQSLERRDDWVNAVLRIYGDKLRGAALFRASLGNTGNVRLGKVTLYRRQNE
jgi:hypothetical protein